MLSEYRASLYRRRLSPATIRLRLYWVVKFAESHDIATATLEQMELYLDSNPRWSGHTRQTIVASLRSFYKWAYRADILSSNPAEDLQRVKVLRRRGRIASDEVIMRALKRSNRVQAAMIRLGAECGLRVSEIANLHMASRYEDWLTIVGKGGQERMVHMREELETLLRAIEVTTARPSYYFPGRDGGPMHPSTVWRHIRDAAGVNPHSLRHRAGTAVYRGTGNDIVTAQEFLGHASPETTQVYIHIEREALMRASAATRLPSVPIDPSSTRRLAA